MRTEADEGGTNGESAEVLPQDYRTSEWGVPTTLEDWPEGSREARYILAGDEVFIRGPKQDYGDGVLRLPVAVKPKGWVSGRDTPVYRPQPALATIYFLGPDGGPIKIGWTVNITTRLRDLRLANALPLKLWASVGGPPSLEREYHKRFAAHRLHGEWFARTPELETEIARLGGEA